MLTCLGGQVGSLEAVLPLADGFANVVALSSVVDQGNEIPGDYLGVMLLLLLLLLHCSGRRFWKQMLDVQGLGCE